MPHFSRISIYAPRRLSYYLLEVTKLVFWVMLPVALLMCFFAEKIFATLFLSPQFDMARVQEAGLILIAFVLGLFFFSLNKIILNIYYALRATLLPLVVSIVAVSCNAVFNYLLMEQMGAAGLALSTSISGLVQTACLIWLLHHHFKFTIYAKPFLQFATRYMMQLTLFLGIFFIVYYGLYRSIEQGFSESAREFLLQGFGFWFWVGPLCLLLFLLLLKMRKQFGIKLHFLPESW